MYNLFTEVGTAAMGASGCGFLDVEDVELGQLSMVTETVEWSSPVNTAGNISNCGGMSYSHSTPVERTHWDRSFCPL